MSCRVLITFVLVFAAVALHAPTAATTAPHPRRSETPTQVTVTEPRGFAWPEALAGAAIASALVAIAAGTADAGRRRRAHRDSNH